VVEGRDYTVVLHIVYFCHPRKMAVRFEDEDGVKRAVRGAVRDALLESGLVRSQAPRGRSKPGDAEISPASASDASENDGASSRGTGGQSVADGATDLPSGFDRDEATTQAESTADTGRQTDFGADAGGAGRDGRDRGERDATGSGRDATGSERLGAETDASFDPPTENARLASDAANDGFDSLPEMDVLGQLAETYVVSETDDGLVLVDQHAADERIHYERLRERPDGTSQSLVEPVALELTAGEAAVFDAALPDLRDLGFEATLDGQTVRVKAVPAVLADALDPELARDVLAEFVADAGGDPAGDAADDLLADMACRPAVTGNTSLPEGRVVALLDALDDCENPFACPHGRPTLVRVDADELASRFERDYPGHGGRRRE
jgi:DNA mismatch repair protein MutL